MKITLTIELDLPDSIDLVEGAETASLGQLLFDSYVNYVTVSHLVDAQKWCVKARLGSESEDPGAKLIYHYHNTWADICQNATWKFEKVG
jgi:hypothetical protein